MNRNQSKHLKLEPSDTGFCGADTDTNTGSEPIYHPILLYTLNIDFNKHFYNDPSNVFINTGDKDAHKAEYLTV